MSAVHSLKVIFMIKTIILILSMLTMSGRLKAGFLIILLIFVALFDVAGVASIMPFMAVLANPDAIASNSNLLFITSYFSFLNEKNITFFLAIFSLFVLLLSLIFKALVTYVQIRFVLMQEYTISTRLVEIYLGQPYSWFLSQNGADLGKNVLSEVQVIMSNAATPLLHFIAHGLVSVALIGLLVFIDFELALNVVSVLGVTYCILYLCVRGHLMKTGGKRLKSNQQRFLVVSELFGAIREVKMSQTEQIYSAKFKNSAKKYAENQSVARSIAQLPRFFIEGIAFGGMILLIMYLLRTRGGFSEIIPILSLYAFAGYRLLPALQQVYAAVTQIRFIFPTVDALSKEIANLKLEANDVSNAVIRLKREIEFNGVCFKYEGSSRSAITKANFTIPVGSFVGVIGKTGSGKSTLVDLMLGLLVPQQGAICVDGEVLSERNNSFWRSQIGYVPQSIYLTDDTISKNIAFGFEQREINDEALVRAAKLAGAYDFIVDELEHGFNTNVGERGARLSGGQIQRIGIARALYRYPSILVLDEATSALDVETEKLILSNLTKNLGHLTLIMITHRASTVKTCDQVLRINRGAVKSLSPPFSF